MAHSNDTDDYTVMCTERHWTIIVKPPYGTTTKEFERRRNECADIKLTLDETMVRTLQKIQTTLDGDFTLELESAGRRTFLHNPTSSSWVAIWRQRGENGDGNRLIAYWDVPPEDLAIENPLAKQIHTALWAAIMDFHRHGDPNISPLKRRRIIPEASQAAVPDPLS